MQTWCAHVQCDRTIALCPPGFCTDTCSSRHGGLLCEVVRIGISAQALMITRRGVRQPAHGLHARPQLDMNVSNKCTLGNAATLSCDVPTAVSNKYSRWAADHDVRNPSARAQLWHVAVRLMYTNASSAVCAQLYVYCAVCWGTARVESRSCGCALLVPEGGAMAFERWLRPAGEGAHSVCLILPSSVPRRPLDCVLGDNCDARRLIAWCAAWCAALWWPLWHCL